MHLSNCVNRSIHCSQPSKKLLCCTYKRSDKLISGSIMVMAMNDIGRLHDIVQTLPIGPIDLDTEVGKTVLNRLATAWPKLTGSDCEGTTADKLWRAEDLPWKPPLITFSLERHRITGQGSSRADVHHWQVDLENGSAQIAYRTHRQLKKTNKSVDCSALAHDVAAVVQAGGNRNGLEWNEDWTTVTITMSALLDPDGKAPPKTIAGRRKRFQTAFLPLMTQLGWVLHPKGNRMRFSRATKVE